MPERNEHPPEKHGRKLTRRDLLGTGLRAGAAVGLAGAGLPLLLRATKAGDDGMVWQLDPYKCTRCGLCATACVLNPSAVKCVHAFDICWRCDFCFGYYRSQRGSASNTGAEFQLCPTGALTRNHVAGPHYDYTIDEPKCIGCGLCVDGCSKFGQKSLFLQVRHDRCLNCNDCAIARICPPQAFRRVPASQPYLLKRKEDA